MSDKTGPQQDSRHHVTLIEIDRVWSAGVPSRMQMLAEANVMLLATPGFGKMPAPCRDRRATARSAFLPCGSRVVRLNCPVSGELCTRLPGTRVEIRSARANSDPAASAALWVVLRMLPVLYRTSHLAHLRSRLCDVLVLWENTADGVRRQRRTGYRGSRPRY